MMVGPNPRTGVLVRRGNFGHRYTGRRPCDDRSRDWSDAATSQGTPRIADDHWKLGERDGTETPSEPPEGPNPPDTLVWDF